MTDPKANLTPENFLASNPSFSLSREIKKRLKEFAAERDAKMSPIVEQALSEFLDKAEAEELTHDRLTEIARFLYDNKSVLLGTLFSMADRFERFEQTQSELANYVYSLFGKPNSWNEFTPPNGEVFEEESKLAMIAYLNKGDIAKTEPSPDEKTKSELRLAARVSAMLERGEFIQKMIETMPFMADPSLLLKEELGSYVIYDKRFKNQHDETGLFIKHFLILTVIYDNDVEMMFPIDRPYFMRANETNDRPSQFARGIADVASAIETVMADYIAYRRFNP